MIERDVLSSGANVAIEEGIEGGRLDAGEIAGTMIGTYLGDEAVNVTTAYINSVQKREYEKAKAAASAGNGMNGSVPGGSRSPGEASVSERNPGKQSAGNQQSNDGWFNPAAMQQEEWNNAVALGDVYAHANSGPSFGAPSPSKSYAASQQAARSSRAERWGTTTKAPQENSFWSLIDEIDRFDEASQAGMTDALGTTNYIGKYGLSGLDVGEEVAYLAGAALGDVASIMTGEGVGEVLAMNAPKVLGVVNAARFGAEQLYQETKLGVKSLLRPGMFGKADVMPELFENQFPEDVINRPNIFTKSQLRTYTGKLNYVVSEDSKVIVGKRINMPGGGHIDLAAGKPVQAAGEIKLVNGQIKYLDNSSGHYLPIGDNVRQVAEKAFSELGFDAQGRYIEKAWVPDLLHPRGGMWRATS